MKVHEFSYRVEGESGPLNTSDQDIVFSTADGQLFELFGVSSDGELTIVNLQPCEAEPHQPSCVR